MEGDEGEVWRTVELPGNTNVSSNKPCIIPSFFLNYTFINWTEIQFEIPDTTMYLLIAGPVLQADGLHIKLILCSSLRQ